MNRDYYIAMAVAMRLRSLAWVAQARALAMLADADKAAQDALTWADEANEQAAEYERLAGEA